MYFITEQWEGEPCVLTGNEMKTLTIKSIDNVVLVTIEPSIPWTHDLLMSLDLSAVHGMEGGADAYLGTEWIGSTEC